MHIHLWFTCIALCNILHSAIHVHGCSTQSGSQKMLLVLAPPRKDDPYYEGQDLVQFYKNYYMAVKGKDDVVVIVDKNNYEHYKNAGIPDDVLLVDDIFDPWIRDFTYVRPATPKRFKYIGGGNLSEAEDIQAGFLKMAAKYKIKFGYSPYFIDGGNVVSNGCDKAIVTDKFCDDNSLTVAEAKKILTEALNVREVSIVSADEPKLGHSDGMVSITGNYTVLLTSYTEPFRSKVMSELKADLPGTTIVEMPSFVDSSKWKGGYASSCGVYVNSVVTDKYIYLPQFGHALDQQAKRVMEANSNGKTVVPIDVRPVCKMGGSLRCLSWQVIGENAEKLKAAASGSKQVVASFTTSCLIILFATFLA